MMPGGRMNDRNVKLMMKRMGMTTETLNDVEEVIIRRANDEMVVENAEVTVVTVQGVKTFQIVGETKTRPKGSGTVSASVAAPPAGPVGPPEEDVELVMSQASVDRETAIRALKAANGEPAEAILKLMSHR